MAILHGEASNSVDERAGSILLRRNFDWGVGKEEIIWDNREVGFFSNFLLWCYTVEDRVLDGC